MARITSINPIAARSLAELADTLRQNELNAQLAKTALQATAQHHKIASAKAKRQHARRPKVELV